MPKAKLDDPAMTVVRIRREQLDSAYRKSNIHAEAAARHWKAWEESRRRLGSAGDPALMHAAETETQRWKEMAQDLIKPAAQAYAEAIAKAVQGGRAVPSGPFSVEEALKLLSNLDAESQRLFNENALPLHECASVLDRMAEDVLKWCTLDKSPSRLNIAIEILKVADAVESSQWTAAWSRYNRMTRQQEQDLTNELQQKNPGIRKLREFIDGIFASADLTHAN